MENTKLYAALDAVRDPSGNIVCRVTLTNPGLYPGCVPLNVLGEGTASPAALDYVTGTSEYEANNKMDSAQASISGDLFEGWAGPVSFAFGGEYRKASLVQTSNSDPTIPTDFTGLRGVVNSGRLRFGVLNVGTAKGSYEVKELFGELNVPVLRDSAIGSLELNGAARYTHYSTSGGVTTWKLGGVFDPVDGVRFRTTVSRDIRAPTLFELFSGQTSTVITFADRLTGSQATSQQVSGGNPNLTPEIAKTFTAGIILQPSVIPGLNFSADYFNIKISDAIGTPFSAFQTVDLCYASNFTSQLCNQIVRPLGASNPDPSNTPSQVFTNLQNISQLGLSGIDFELSYGRPVGNGRITARIQATRQITFNQAVAPGQPVVAYVGTADFNDVQFPLPLPKWRGAINLGYESDHFSINVQERLIGGYDRSHLQVVVPNRVPAVGYTDLSLTYKLRTSFAGQIELFGTVNNLFDKKAPLIPVTRTPGLTVPTIRSTYDVVGTYITVGARVKM
jgi:outer membrane receptor protein involved in Fe transport